MKLKKKNQEDLLFGWDIICGPWNMLENLPAKPEFNMKTPPLSWMDDKQRLYMKNLVYYESNLFVFSLRRLKIIVIAERQDQWNIWKNIL